MFSCLYITVVLYNKRINEITSLDNYIMLKKEKEFVKIYIMDNSTDSSIKDYNNEISNVDYKDCLNYIDNKGNIGLSLSYNKILDLLDENSYIFISDDDTLFSYEYLNNVYNTIRNEESLIVSGIVRTSNGVLSPIKKLKVFKPKNICFPGNYVNIYTINSGLTVSKKIYDIIGKYPKELFLDMVDFWFMDTLKKFKLNHIKIVDGDIKQTFSGNSGYTSGTEYRFKIYKKDMIAYRKLIKHRRVYVFLTLLKRKTHIKIMKRRDKNGA